jgi:glutathione S-transferase
MSYLAEAYGKNLDTLYPKLPKERALVHQRMYFDMGSLYDALIPYFRSRLGGKEGDLEKKNAIDGPLDYLNQFLEGQDYVAGAHLTLADLCAVSTVSSIEALDVDIKRFANVWRWYQLCQETIPGYEVNSRGADLLKKFVS